MDSESLLVIDGHNIEVENNELHIVNDVRQVYDANLKQSINTIKNSLSNKPQKTVSQQSDINIKLSENNRHIEITNGTIFEITVNETIEINIFKSKEKVFNLHSNQEKKFAPEEFGSKIQPQDKSLHYFSDGNSTVFSNPVTNRIIKYSSEESLNGHLYTKYYEYSEKHNIGIYLLMVDYTPINLTTYYCKQNNATTIIHFE